jgi:hypothetical protein
VSDAGQEAAARIAALETSLSDALREAEDAQQALQSRDVIDRAKDVLRERGQVSPEELFDQLFSVSQEVNLKLLDLAARIAEREVSRGEMIRRLDDAAEYAAKTLSNGSLPRDEQHALAATLAKLLPLVADSLQLQLDTETAMALARDRDERR